MVSRRLHPGQGQQSPLAAEAKSVAKARPSPRRRASADRAGSLDLLRGRSRPDPAPAPGPDLGSARAHPGRAGVGQRFRPDLDRRAARLPQRVPPPPVLPGGHPPRASRGTPQPVRGRLRRPAVRRSGLGSSTSPASRPCWGRSTAGPAPRCRPGWPPAHPSSGPGCRWW